MNKEVIFTFEFEQFLSSIKTDQDFAKTILIDDDLLVVLLVSFTARFFYICDNRQFYPMKSYLHNLFSKSFNNGKELYALGVSQELLNIVYRTFLENEKRAALNLFGKGSFFPFDKAPCILFGHEAYENKSQPICTYKFILKVKKGKVFYKYKMPFLFNPTKVFTPLALGFVIEYVYLNFKSMDYFAHSKKLLLDLLDHINSNKFVEYTLVNSILSKQLLRIG